MWVRVGFINIFKPQLIRNKAGRRFLGLCLLNSSQLIKLRACQLQITADYEQKYERFRSRTLSTKHQKSRRSNFVKPNFSIKKNSQ